jgi:hypothetical protein
MHLCSPLLAFSHGCRLALSKEDTQIGFVHLVRLETDAISAEHGLHMARSFFSAVTRVASRPPCFGEEEAREAVRE